MDNIHKDCPNFVEQNDMCLSFFHFGYHNVSQYPECVGKEVFGDNERFIIPDGEMDIDVTLIDTITGKEYTDNFEDIVAVMNDLDNEMMNARAKSTRLTILLKDIVTEYERKSGEFAKMAEYIRKNGNIESLQGRMDNE